MRKHLHKQVGTTINRHTKQVQYFCITNFWNKIAHNTISFQSQNQSKSLNKDDDIPETKTHFHVLDLDLWIH